MNTTNMDKQDDKQEHVIPKLRFPEFQTTLGWDTFKLKDVSTRILDKVGDKKLMPISITAGVGIVSQEEKFGKNISGKQYKNYLILNKGDFVYNKGNSKKYPQGAIYYLDKWEKVAAPNVFLCFRLKSDQVHGFYQGYFDNNAHGIQLQKYITSGARSDGLLNISADTFFNLSFAIPDPKEQQKIADCLSSIDELIELQEQKLAALKQHKKGLMQQLFPSHNDLQASKQASKQIVYPKLRFPQFKDCKGWEVVRISDLLVEKKRPVKLENETEYCLVTVKRRHGGITLREVAKGKEIKVQSQFRVFTDDFLISKRQIVHCACGVLPEELDGSIVSNEYSVLNAKENVNITFFNYFCHQPIVEKSFLDCSSGIVIEKMLFKLDEWMKQEFYFPKNPKEQQAIAECLSSLDKLISEENEQIGRLKDHKKGLMQQLFPIFRSQHE